MPLLRGERQDQNPIHSLSGDGQRTRIQQSPRRATRGTKGQYQTGAVSKTKACVSLTIVISAPLLQIAKSPESEVKGSGHVHEASGSKERKEERQAPRARTRESQRTKEGKRREGKEERREKTRKRSDRQTTKTGLSDTVPSSNPRANLD